MLFTQEKIDFHKKYEADIEEIITDSGIVISVMHGWKLRDSILNRMKEKGILE